jgi:hypothetical protein
MAWEFDYKLSLRFEGFTLNPDEISAQITHLLPEVTRLGDRTPSGGYARYPVWYARLHAPEFLSSEVRTLEDELRESLDKLRQHAPLIRRLRQEGSAYLQIVFMCDRHAVATVPPEVLELCGSLELTLDLEYWFVERKSSN